MYVFCFVLVLIAPLAMLGVGVYWTMSPPAYKTGRVAYRTELTERSPEVWAFVHNYCAKLWVRYGGILAILCTAAMIFLKEKYKTYLLWLLGGQMAVLCVTILLMDLFVKNIFDENGKPVDHKRNAEVPAMIEEDKE